MFDRFIFSLAALQAFSVISLAGHALAADPALELCQLRDDRADSASVSRFFDQTLKEHGRYAAFRPLKAKAATKAIAFLDQRILDRRSELCADRLKVAEGIKAAPAKANCAGAVLAGLLDGYAARVAAAYEGNRAMLATLRDDHARELKRKLFDIARGSNEGLEGTYGGYALSAMPKEVRFEWLKQEASKLGGEAQQVWGAAEPDRNPLVQMNLSFAREALRARQERDAAKARFGEPDPGCKAP
jgi:hypothetical protein